MIKRIIRTAKWMPGGVFHVGAHKFEELEDYQILGFSPVIWFDPQDAYLPTELPDNQFFHKCVIQDSDDLTVTFNLYKDATGFSSIHQVSGSVSKFFTSMPNHFERIEVSSHKLSSFQERYVSLYPSRTWTLVISTQGSETSVLTSTNLDLIDNIAIRTSKEEIYQNAGNTFEETKDFLTNACFNLNLDLSDPIFGHGWQYYSKHNKRHYRLLESYLDCIWFVHWIYTLIYRALISMKITFLNKMVTKVKTFL